MWFKAMFHRKTFESVIHQYARLIRRAERRGDRAMANSLIRAVSYELRLDRDRTGDSRDVSE